MKILLTGARGMVGMNVQEHPLAQRYELLCPSHDQLDLSHFKAVDEYLKQNSPDLIIHAAGRVGGIQANIKNPVEFLVQNVDIGRNVILAAQQNGIKKLINLASSCLYPKQAPNPLTEDLILTGPLEPTNEGYALAKIFAQRLCAYIAHEFPEFQYKTLIPCNLFGRWDKFDPRHSHLLPAIIYKVHQAILSGKDEIDVWGSGLARREFMYAGDLADCIYACIERYNEVPALMNVGLGVDHSINDYYQIVARVLQFKGSFVHDLSKPEGMKQKLTSIQRAKEFGWSGKTSLEQGIRKAFEFYLEKGS